MAGNPPVAKYKAKGNGLQLAVWKNTYDGKDFYTFSLSRRYCKKDSDQWETTMSLRGQDLLPAAALLRQAYEDGYVEYDDSAPSGKRADTSLHEEPSPF